MRVITFYSFKGGVGRSNLLYNVAYLLAAEQDRRVIVADWDLHAPGLTCLPDMQEPDGPLLRPGVVDLLTELANEMSGEASTALDPGDLVRPTHLGQRIRAKGSEGDIWFLPAGAFKPEQESAYREQVQKLRPRLSKLVEKGGKDLLAWLVERITARFKDDPKAPEVLLLDARTSLTEVGELLLSRIPNHQRVLVFGLNEQDRQVMEPLLRWLLEETEPEKLPSRLVMVASPVSRGEEELTQKRLGRVRAIVRAIVEEVSAKVGVSPAVPEIRTVPYDPRVALTKAPMVERYPESEIARAFASVTELVRDRPLALEQVKAEVRLRMRAKSQARPPEPPEPPEPLHAEAGDMEHPLSRPLPWNVVRPDASPALLLDHPRAEELLNGLANSVSLDDNQRRAILASISERSSKDKEIEGLIRAFEQEARQFRQLPSVHWPGLAEVHGRDWADWALLSASFLNVESRVAAERLRNDWPYALEGRIGIRATFGALDRLAEGSDELKAVAGEWLGALVASTVDDADVLRRAGTRYFRFFGDVATGSSCFQRAVLAAPEDAESEFAWGFAFHVLGEGNRTIDPVKAFALFADAEDHYRKALDLNPDMYEVEHNWGNSIFERARLLRDKEPAKAFALFDDAEDHYRKALDIEPEMHEAECNRGNAIFERARLLGEKEPEKALALFADAEAYYRKALDLKPDMHEAACNGGNSIFERARLLRHKEPEKALALFAKAEDHYRKALDVKPDMHEAACNWGNALAERAQILRDEEPEEALALFAKAEAHYREALDLKPDMHEAECIWGNAIFGRARLLRDKEPGEALALFAEAEEHYRASLDLKPEDPEAEYNWGNSIFERAELLRDQEPEEALALFAEAEARYRASLDLEPEDPEAENNWGNSVLERARLLLGQDPDKALVLFADAEDHYRKALAVKPEMPEAENNWGTAISHRARLLRHEDPDKALALFAEAETHCRKALALKPEMHEAECNWGNSISHRARLLRRTDPDEALALFADAEDHYRKALDIDPGMHEPEFNWGNSIFERVRLLRDKDPDKALALLTEAEIHYRKALDLRPDDRETMDDCASVLLSRNHLLTARGSTDEAATAVEEALRLTRRVSELHDKPSYNLACALALHGDTEEALATLESLPRDGELPDPDWLLKDSDLAPLRGHPRFEALVQSAHDPQKPS